MSFPILLMTVPCSKAETISLDKRRYVLLSGASDLAEDKNEEEGGSFIYRRQQVKPSHLPVVRFGRSSPEDLESG